MQVIAAIWNRTAICMSEIVEGDSRPKSQPSEITDARPIAAPSQSVNHRIFRALLSLASANLLIRVMGMLNQVVVTARFGQGSTMDAYYVAQALPVLLAQMFSSALESSVIPVYTQIHDRGRTCPYPTPNNNDQASRLFSTLLNLLIIGFILCITTMFLFRRQLIFFSAPALKAHTLVLATNLTPLIFPMLLFMTLNSFMECLLNAEGQFGWPAYIGILVPITTATFVLLGGKSIGITMLCIGTLVGQVLQLVMVMIRAHAINIRYRFVLDLRSKEIAVIAGLAWPVLFGALISQASPIVDQIFASQLSDGSIAAINNALKLISVPVGVIFASAGRAMLPYLAHQVISKNIPAFKATFRLYLWLVSISTAIMTAAMILLARPIVQILFQHGAFSVADAHRTANTLIGFSIGLTPMAIGFIAARAFSALGKTRVLMYVTIFSIFANALFDYIFGRLWQSFGIAFATSIVYSCTMIILLALLRGTIGKLGLFTLPQEILATIWKPGPASYYARWITWKKGV